MDLMEPLQFWPYDAGRGQATVSAAVNSLFEDLLEPLQQGHADIFSGDDEFLPHFTMHQEQFGQLPSSFTQNVAEYTQPVAHSRTITTGVHGVANGFQVQPAVLIPWQSSSSGTSDSVQPPQGTWELQHPVRHSDADPKLALQVSATAQDSAKRRSRRSYHDCNRNVRDSIASLQRELASKLSLVEQLQAQNDELKRKERVLQSAVGTSEKSFRALADGGISNHLAEMVKSFKGITNMQEASKVVARVAKISDAKDFTVHDLRACWRSLVLEIGDGLTAESMAATEEERAASRAHMADVSNKVVDFTLALSLNNHKVLMQALTTNLHTGAQEEAPPEVWDRALAALELTEEQKRGMMDVLRMFAHSHRQNFVERVELQRQIAELTSATIVGISDLGAAATTVGQDGTPPGGVMPLPLTASAPGLTATMPLTTKGSNSLLKCPFPIGADGATPCSSAATLHSMACAAVAARDAAAAAHAAGAAPGGSSRDNNTSDGSRGERVTSATTGVAATVASTPAPAGATASRQAHVQSPESAYSMLCCMPQHIENRSRLEELVGKLESNSVRCNTVSRLVAFLVLQIMTPIQKGKMSFTCWPYFPRTVALLWALQQQEQQQQQQQEQQQQQQGRRV